MPETHGGRGFRGSAGVIADNFLAPGRALILTWINSVASRVPLWGMVRVSVILLRVRDFTMAKQAVNGGFCRLQSHIMIDTQGQDVT
jgi:hypothetical protein